MASIDGHLELDYNWDSLEPILLEILSPGAPDQHGTQVQLCLKSFQTLQLLTPDSLWQLILSM